MKDWRLLLIYPTVHQLGIDRVKPFWLPPLGLASVAGVTPEGWEIFLIDENVEDINFEMECDLVGIGFMTANSKRAYNIAAEFRKRGKKVILGGPHASVCPDEAAEYADTVIIGDVETIWGKVLQDFQNGSMQKFYKLINSSNSIHVFSNPRRDLYKKEAYLSINSIQTSRGCPHLCSFCSIASRYHRQYGKKNLNSVFQEIERLEDKKSPIFFVDDNIFVDRERSKIFLKGLKQFNIRWWSQADINIVQDEKLLDLAKESGCIKLVVGFESLSNESIKKINKKQNKASNYQKFIETLHRHGILVNTSFAFGADNEGEDVFEKTFKFLKDHRVIFATFNIITPLPGTALFSQMEKEGRLIDRDWRNYDMGHPVFQPVKMSPRALKEGYEWICKEFYSLPQIYERISTIKDKKDIFDINTILAWNLGYKKMLDIFGVFM
ncbi:MAG: B12-binding domain-containing radical SAM protein [Firmicutes bacterium]|nr:B12-binding domain-containing radical SAM protein [Bacillota bacterium]